MRRALGNWVVGEDFWDREAELALLIEDLKEGGNVLLTAPRRIGKTSLMRETARQIQDKFICLQVDLQKAHSPADAIVELSMATKPYLGLWAKTTGLFDSVLSKLTSKIDSLRIDELTITLRSGITGTDWQAKGDRLFEALSESELPVVIFFDEVPILVNRLLQGSDYRITAERRSETDAFMSWLRQNSIRHQKKVRMVVTGSIGFEPILHLAGLNATLNTFTPFPLRAWTNDIALSFIRASAIEYGLNLRDGAEQQMITQLGCCIPHYVQVFFDRVYRYSKLRETTEITPAIIDDVYRTEMLSIQGHAELSHLEERLKTVLGPDLYPFALAILTEVAVTDAMDTEAADAIAKQYAIEGKLPSNSLRDILGILEHDGYLEQNNNHEYCFVSKLVHDWWKARFAFGYKPAAKQKVAPR